MKKKYLYLAAIIFLFISCAITTAHLFIDLPEVPIQKNVKGKVFIREIKDLRAGKEPINTNIIGIKVRGGTIVTTQETPRYIIRKFYTIREAPGGSIILENYNNVSEFLKQMLELSFKSKGYEIVNEKNSDAIIVDANIDTLWVSAKRGAKMNIFSHIYVDIFLNLTDRSHTYKVSSSASKSYHIATDAKYKEIFLESVNEFVEKFKSNISEFEIK